MEFIIMMIKFILLNIFFLVIIHEIGHIIAGLMCGHKFSGLYCLFFCIIKKDGKWKIEKLSKDCRSIAIYSINSKDSSLLEYIFIIVAGSLFNIICGLFLILSSDFLYCIIGYSCLICGVFNIIFFSKNSMSDGSKIMRCITKKTRNYEILDYNIAQRMIRENKIVLEDVEKLINSNIDYYMIKGCYYKSCLVDITENDKNILIEKQSKINIPSGLKCFQIV